MSARASPGRLAVTQMHAMLWLASRLGALPAFAHGAAQQEDITIVLAKRKAAA